MNFRNHEYTYHLTGAAPSMPVEIKAGPYGNRWFIVMGFAGFNSPTNNRSGYADMNGALRASRNYQNKGRKNGPAWVGAS